MMSIAEVLAVAFGGAAGALSRHGVHVMFHAFGSVFATNYAITAVNLIGAFAIGSLYIYVQDSSPVVKLFLISGFLGAFTTVSGFALESVLQLQSSRWLDVVVFWILNSLATVGCCYLGYKCFS